MAIDCSESKPFLAAANSALTSFDDSLENVGDVALNNDIVEFECDNTDGTEAVAVEDDDEGEESDDEFDVVEIVEVRVVDEVRCESPPLVVGNESANVFNAGTIRNCHNTFLYHHHHHHY